MPRIKVLLPLFACLMLASSLAAQGGLKKTGSKTVDSTYLSLDSLTIVPGTFVLVGLDSADYQVDYLNGGIRILNPQAMGKT